MIKGRTSIIIPSRNERYLQVTVADLLAKAEGDVEILVFIEGLPMPDPPLPDDPRIRVIVNDPPIHMRPCINQGAELATGEFLMKIDAHCIVGEGYDAILKADCDDDWLVVPTRHSIHPKTWTRRRMDFNYSILTYPFCRSVYGQGFHAVTLGPENKTVNEQRAQLPIDDILSAQGSMWFQRAAYFRSFPPLDHAGMDFWQESQEVMGRVLASGGRCIVNKKTSYCHLHKGKDNEGADGRPGRGYFVSLRKKDQAEARMVDMLLYGRWPYPLNVTRSFESIIEKHWWLISQATDPKYVWPEDWRDWEKHRAAFQARSEAELPAHLARA